jgi:tetratricopeptide (TPR) repeat protein
MSPATTTTTQTTLITAPNPSNMSPLEGAMMDACNQLHEAVGQGDDAAIERLQVSLAGMLERYEASGADNHPNAQWAVPHQRALALSAGSDTEAAIVYEEIALEHADTDRQREISLGNLAERSMRAGRPEQAVEFFFRARDIAPRSVPIMLTGAQVLYAAGYLSESNRIFAALAAMPRLLREGTELTVYLDYETRLQTMRPDLPALDALMTRWESMRGAEEV